MLVYMCVSTLQLIFTILDMTEIPPLRITYLQFEKYCATKQNSFESIWPSVFYV